MTDRPATPIQTDQAPGPSHGAPYSQGLVHGDLVFISGQLPIDPATGALVPGGITEQAEQAIRNAEAVLHAGGSGLDRLLSITVYLRSREDWEPMNRVYADLVGDPKPTRTAVEVWPLPFDARIELTAIGYRGGSA